MSLLIKIREFDGFSSSENLVAKYILDNYTKIIELEGQDIADKTYTSNSTVTRTCKKIGFSGFQELKLRLVEELSIFNKENMIFDNSDIEKELSTEDIISKLNKLSISSLNENVLLQDAVQIEKVVSIIKEKDVIDFYGMGASHIVCLDAQYKFMRAGKVSNCFQGTDQQYVQAVNSKQNHIAILISYSGVTPELIKIADILLAKGIDTVSITRYTDSPLVKRCKYNLFVTSKENLTRSAAIYSRISMLNLIDVIYMTYSNKNFDEVSRKITETAIKK